MEKIVLKRTNSSAPEFRTLVVALDADLRERYGALMDTYDQHNVIEQLDTVVLVFLDDVAVGCGCFKPFDADSVEIKRVFLAPEARRKGLSVKLLAELENWAQELGFTYAVLETGSKQFEAIGLYEKAGYVGIPNYEPYIGLAESICYKKTLVAS
jgi:putative acetyltransferase